MVTNDFKELLCDRFTAAELAEFLDVTVEDFCEMFEADIEYNYDELCEFMNLNSEDADNDNDAGSEDYE